MVRSDSAEEDQIIIDDGFDLTEEDEEMMSSGTGALPVTIADWNSVTNARMAPPSIMSAASAFDLTASGMQNSLRSVLPTSTIGHAPMLANRSLSQPAPLSPTSLDPDRRMRRQIANCNERRRMQSINAGFLALRALLPRKEGEKLSKAAILQQTADMVHQLLGHKGEDIPDGGEPKKLKLEEDHHDADHQAQIAHLQTILETERAARKALESQVIQLRELLQMTTTSSQASSPVTPRSNGSGGFTLPSSYASSALPTPLRESPERKPSFQDTTSTPLSLLTLNGSPTSSESLASQRIFHPPPTLPSLETTVIRPTPLPPISVEISSPSLSTPSPLTAAPIIFSTAVPTQSSILFQTAAAAVTSAMSTGNSTPVALPHHLQGHNSAFVSTQPSLTLSQSMQTIVEAIRHLEGSHFIPTSPPPTSQTSLVR
ncbi:Helix-loop-helix protein 11 [Caenorhabditis elegans]|uniref:Isoform a of Helix-loop-helix protein 11 n=1 Tax=Caenorhabditis elegans TaxID=6239 RepID=P34474-2|nr:Helix-loop-helix protein 11 [Caenorhabditis elegans]CAA80167.2 Helix-loop-helix protein 11 [Caenorhabditis elegans]|eukprot:NP_499130.2 Helix-loop-helix protein 11 [Caenorhabditis elegans]